MTAFAFRQEVGLTKIESQSHVLLYVGLALFAVSVIGVAIPSWWLLEPVPVVSLGVPTVYGDDGRLNVIRPGGTITVRRDFCVDRQMAGVVTREIRQGNVSWQLSAHAVTSRPGCREGVYTNDLPTTLPPWEYEYVATLDYEINPLRRYRVILPSGKVRVEK